MTIGLLQATGLVHCVQQPMRASEFATALLLGFGNEMRNHKGFSLIELLIVVAIILIIAAIAIPNLMRAKMAANDSSAAQSLRQINTAELAYFATYPTIGYPAALATLGGAGPCTPSITTACALDNYLATNGAGAGKSGYSFNATGSPSAGSAVNDQFYATGTPLSAQFGTRALCAIQDGVIRIQPAGTITLVPSYTSCYALNPMSN
ncbi:MAG: prepilin-type N-terminal cleavage/methylation domain-containing protein [Candidatus Sulfotelmatobacter sp.]|jgi:prepilin-type N-terminal cleavage/methylation domain-containing protein